MEGLGKRGGRVEGVFSPEIGRGRQGWPSSRTLPGRALPADGYRALAPLPWVQLARTGGWEGYGWLEVISAELKKDHEEFYPAGEQPCFCAAGRPPSPG